MKPTRVPSADGLSLAVYEAGNPDGPAILFLHGFNQAALCWHLQLADRDLLARCRMVAYDIRGHGASDQPDNPARYQRDQDFARAKVIPGAKLSLYHGVGHMPIAEDTPASTTNWPPSSPAAPPVEPHFSVA